MCSSTSARLCCILSFVVGITLAYRYRWWLNYTCFHIKLFIVGFYELEDGREHLDYDYDIDIIFPDRDEAWAKQEFLGALTEHAPQFDRERIVCGEDDLPLGGVRMDAIDYVIENSFKIIVIVSNASVNDAHFLTQLQDGGGAHERGPTGEGGDWSFERTYPTTSCRTWWGCSWVRTNRTSGGTDEWVRSETLLGETREGFESQ